ncbi:MAG: cadherin-like domain-containing protein [Proteobacteria bacterium]|nr:cadherin-like domain-containing protein [Pseudomonadota bacterium]
MRSDIQRGFTLVEAMLAVGIAAIILLIALPIYNNYMTNSRTVDPINALEALSLEVRAPSDGSGGLKVCDASLVSAGNLQSDYLDLSIIAVPNDLSAPNGPLGFGAAVNVSARLDTQGKTGIDVARRFYEEIKNGRGGSLIDGAITDSAVAYAIRLSDPGVPFCDTSATAISALSAPPPGGANRAPVAGKDIDLGQTKEDTPIAINTGALTAASWDPDGDALTITRISGSSGTISGNPGSGFEYQPAKDFHGDDVQLRFEVSDGNATANGTALIDVTSVVDPPRVDLTISAAQKVLDTGTSGRAVVSGLQTGGDMQAMTLEFSVVGKQGGTAGASTGPVIFNYGTQTNNNVISAWRPSNFTVAIAGVNYDSNINIADGSNHRVTVSWTAATGILKIFDNGVLARTFTGVSQGSAVPGMGHLVIGQKMNDPSSGGGWNANEHYSGQVFGATLSTHAYSDQEIAQAPLYTQKQGIVADIRNQGGGMQDQTGRHQVDMNGDFTSSTVQVDTALALIPPASEVRLTAKADAGDADSKITAITISGLGALTLTDGVNSGSGTVDVTNWNLSALRINLPAGFSDNAQLNLSATSSDGVNVASADTVKVLRMRP